MAGIPEELGERISELEIWGFQFGRLATRIEFESYSNGVEFANEVFELAEESGNFPEVKVQEDAVEIDVGDENVTEEDVELAEEIEERLKDLELD